MKHSKERKKERAQKRLVKKQMRYEMETLNKRLGYILSERLTTGSIDVMLYRSTVRRIAELRNQIAEIEGRKVQPLMSPEEIRLKSQLRDIEQIYIKKGETEKPSTKATTRILSKAEAWHMALHPKQEMTISDEL